MVKRLLLILVLISFITSFVSAGSWERDDSIGVGIPSNHAQIDLIYNLKNDGFWRGMWTSLHAYYWNGSSWVYDNSTLKGLEFPNHPNEYIFNLTGQEDWTAVATIGQTSTGFYWNGSEWIKDNSRVAGIDEALIASGGIFTAYGYDFERGFIDDNFTFWLTAYNGVKIGYYWNGTYWVHDNNRVNGISPSFGWQMFYDSSCDQWNAITCGWYGEVDKISAYVWNGSEWIENSSRAPTGFSDSKCQVTIGENFTGDGSRWLLISGESRHINGFRYVGGCYDDNDGDGFTSDVDCNDNDVSVHPPSDGMIITKNTTFCPGEYYLPNGISIGANDVVLDCNGAILVGNGSQKYNFYTGGIMLRSGNLIKKCHIKNYSNGYRVQGGNIILKNNIAENNLNGFLIIGGSNNLTENKAINNSLSGYFIRGSDFYVDNNSAIGNGMNGIYFYGQHEKSQNHKVFNNLLVKNGQESIGSDSSGVKFYRSYNNLVLNNTFVENGDGLKICCENYTIRNNTIYNNKEYGLIGGGNNVLIEDNFFQDNYYNNIFFRGDGLVFKKNILIGSRYNLFRSLKNSIISQNLFEEAYYDSIRLDYSSFNNSIWNNILYNKGISDENESLNLYCVDCIGNNYYDGATGPTCPSSCDDLDNDGVLDIDDKCLGTIEEQLIYGCSCKQILELKPGEDSGECSTGTLEVFEKAIGWAKDLF